MGGDDVQYLIVCVMYVYPRMGQEQFRVSLYLVNTFLLYCLYLLFTKFSDTDGQCLPLKFASIFFQCLILESIHVCATEVLQKKDHLESQERPVRHHLKRCLNLISRIRRIRLELQFSLFILSSLYHVVNNRYAATFCLYLGLMI